MNVMGDALATGIMAHICRKDFIKEGEEVGGYMYLYSLWYVGGHLGDAPGQISKFFHFFKDSSYL